jgi:hypothetical protein
MTCADLKTAIMHLDKVDQRQLMLAVLPEIWPNLAEDVACLKLIRQLVDEASVKEYQQEHLDHI